MNILIVHNYYSVQGGEESVVAFQKKLLESKGHDVVVYSRNYHEMKQWKLGKIGGLITSIYNRRSINDINQILEDFNPEIALIHNLFPIISPSIIPFLRDKAVRVYQIIHNYRLFCPIGIFYRNHHICHNCLKLGREWNCLIHKCNQSLAASFSYSCRAYFVRKLNYFRSVSKFLVLSDFQKQMLIENGYKNIPIEVIPNSFIPKTNINIDQIDFAKKIKIGFVGRLTKEKGFYDFIEIARRLPQYLFQVAGDYSQLDHSIEIPSNIEFKGLLNQDQLSEFYENTKVLLFLSRWYEGFPMVLLEAMHHCTPLIVTNLGVMPEVIEHEVNGFVVKAGDYEAIEKRIQMIYSNNDQYLEFAITGKKRSEEFYSSERYYERLMLAVSEERPMH